MAKQNMPKTKTTQKSPTKNSEKEGKSIEKLIAETNLLLAMILKELTKNKSPFAE